MNCTQCIKSSTNRTKRTLRLCSPLQYESAVLHYSDDWTRMYAQTPLSSGFVLDLMYSSVHFSTTMFAHSYSKVITNVLRQVNAIYVNSSVLRWLPPRTRKEQEIDGDKSLVASSRLYNLLHDKSTATCCTTGCTADQQQIEVMEFAPMID